MMTVNATLELLDLPSRASAAVGMKEPPSQDVQCHWVPGMIRRLQQ